MALKLMYITNQPHVAKIAEQTGVDRIFVDMEYIGKAARQGGMDTVQSHHTIDDIRRIRSAVTTAEVLVRVNPIHGASDTFVSSREEIDDAIGAGADVLMLPYFKTLEEVKTFLQLVKGRAKTSLLVETPEAVDILDAILSLEGIDEIHIGLNDLHLGYHKKFMFELLADGTVDVLCAKCRRAGIRYGFGGIASLGKGMLPSEHVIREHYRLGSTCAILSRSFCNTGVITDPEQIAGIFSEGIRQIRELEEECRRHMAYFSENQQFVKDAVQRICEKL